MEMWIASFNVCSFYIYIWERESRKKVRLLEWASKEKGVNMWYKQHKRYLHKMKSIRIKWGKIYCIDIFTRYQLRIIQFFRLPFLTMKSMHPPRKLYQVFICNILFHFCIAQTKRIPRSTISLHWNSKTGFFLCSFCSESHRFSAYIKTLFVFLCRALLASEVFKLHLPMNWYSSTFSIRFNSITNRISGSRTRQQPTVSM